jgi:hypothetical protein
MPKRLILWLLILVESRVFGGLSTLRVRLLFYITCMYTNLVVIVNGDYFVDKSVFISRLNGLHRLQLT